MTAQMEELERYGKRYLKCSECDYGAFDEAYVRAHVDGVAHREPLPPGAERGPNWTPGPGEELFEGSGEPMEAIEVAEGETAELTQDGPGEELPEIESTEPEPDVDDAEKRSAKS